MNSDFEEYMKSRDEAPSPTRALLPWPVLLSVMNYALLSFIDISYRAIQPLFYSTPVELGGLGQSPAQIGMLLAAFGIMNGTVQAFYFPALIDRWGPKRLFMTGMTTFIPLFVLYPIISFMSQASSSLVWVVVFLQLALGILSDMAYGE